ncbi:MAG: flavodoxin, partial [Thermoclostridium sp.]|nr:flavodoxin [Thermoclostridium sp.]
FVLKNHLILTEKLLQKGFQVREVFGCAGFNTNSILVKFGELNKGRPNAADLKQAEEFAQSVMRKGEA